MDRKALQQVIKTAWNIIGAHLQSIRDIRLIHKQTDSDPSALSAHVREKPSSSMRESGISRWRQVSVNTFLLDSPYSRLTLGLVWSSSFSLLNNLMLLRSEKIVSNYIITQCVPI